MAVLDAPDRRACRRDREKQPATIGKFLFLRGALTRRTYKRADFSVSKPVDCSDGTKYPHTPKPRLRHQNHTPKNGRFQWIASAAFGRSYGPEMRNGAHFWTPWITFGRSSSGGAGIRTPVRDKIDHSVYVRIPPIEVSSRWPVDSPLLDKSSKVSPTDGRRISRLSRIFDTLKAASGGLL